MVKKQERDREAPGDVFGQQARKRPQVMWLFDWTRNKKIEMPQVKQERGNKKKAPGDLMVLFGQEARK